MNRSAGVRIDIVLVGGGHAHVHVLKALATRPEPGVRLTLIARELETPYSGMLPGVVAGLYTTEQAHIDLVRLAAVTGTRLIHAEAVGLDRAAKRVLLRDRPPVAYDLVSIDVGITPDLAPIQGAGEHAIAVKPIATFLARFEALRARCRKPDGPRRIAVIGGGAGGVELLLSVRARLLSDAAADGHADPGFSFLLATDGTILPLHNAGVRDAFRRIFAERRIALHEGRRVAALDADSMAFENGERLGADAILVTTHAAAPAWFAQTGLGLDKSGFLAAGPTLQVLDDADVFAAGDCAALVETPREKAGVYAVRAGPVLADNLRRRARGAAPRPWWPQQRHLSLISTGERYAVASRGRFKAEGAWVWTLKDRIDRRWMRMYQDVDAMRARMARAGDAAPAQPPPDDMRCGGCAAKIGPAPLSRVLARLAPAWSDRSDIVVGLDAADDAAVIAPPAAKHLVQTVDFFRAFIDDPFVFGEIAANHALNDVFAMGGEPRHALAIAVVPPGPAAKVEDDLFQVLAGARACFDRHGVALVGGHSSEGAELALGFAVTGEVAAGRVARKGGLQSGDVLILTKPLGTGIVFAGAMRGRARAPWVEAALAGMRCSNREASRILTDHGVSAMTDVSGFGLAGHLGEMLVASGGAAQLDLAAVPLYPGTLALARDGIASTLLPENLALASLLRGQADDVTRAILLDPQTSGGLLAGVAAQHAPACVARLRAQGCMAGVVGTVTSAGGLPRTATIAVTGTLGG